MVIWLRHRASSLTALSAPQLPAALTDCSKTPALCSVHIFHRLASGAHCPVKNIGGLFSHGVRLINGYLPEGLQAKPRPYFVVTPEKTLEIRCNL